MRSLAALMLLFLAVPASAAPMAPVPIATAGLTDAPPAIDGALDDACWAADAAALEGFVTLDFSGPAPVPTTAWVCRDAERLYLAARCVEPNTGAIVANAVEHDDAVWRDDCVEFFIDTNRDRQSYAHIIANTRGTTYDDITPGDSTWESGAEAAATVGDGEWSVELAIPLASLGGAPQPGDVWGFNVGRERQAGGANELSAWSPTYGKFLEPGRFGDLRFEAEPAWLSASLADEGTFGPRALTIIAPRAIKPAVSLMREWPEGLARDWPTPEPTVADSDQPGQWSAEVRIVDGSETGVVVAQTTDEVTLARRAIPIVISPRPRTALLAREALSVRGRLADLPALGEATAELVAQVTELLDGFVQGNLTRTEPMSAQEWAAQAGAQQTLLVRISGLSCVVWTQSPLLDLARDQAPPSLQPDPTISLRACGNEVECGAFIVSNLSAEMFEGRVTIDDLRFISGEALAATDEGNLLTNGDFRADEDQDGIPDGWNAVGRDGSWALERLPDGSAAFALSGDGRTQVNFRQDVALEAGERYTLVAEISAENLPGASGYVHVINRGWTWSSGVTPITPNSASSEYTASFVAPDSPGFQVVLRLDSAAGGTIRYHHVRLVEGGVEQTTFAPDCLTLHEAQYQDLRVGRTVADPLPVMDEAQVLRVAPGESRQVFLTADTSALPPGDYATSIRLRPLDHEQPQKVIPLRLSVLPVRLPERMPIAVFNWDYARDEHYVQDLAAHHTNTFLLSTGFPMRFDDEGELRAPADWSSYDRLLQVKLRYARECGGIIMFSYGIIRDFNTRMSAAHGWEFMSEPWRRAFRTWVLEFERHLRDDIGMGYEEYAVQLWDEATGENARLTAQAGEFMRGFAPGIRTCMDGAQTPEEVRMLDPVIDLWIPHQAALYARPYSPELRALYAELAARGEPVWTYTCSTNMKALSPLDYYRLKEWRVWDLGVGGSCFWAYNSWRGDPWNDFDGEIADCGTIYDGPAGPITSRRWEATRDGREDYQALHLLREAARARGPETAARAQALIDSLVAEALANPTDIEVFDRARGRLLDVLAQYCGADVPALTEGLSFAWDDSAARVAWETDRPTEGVLHYRVPGDEQWRVLAFDTGTAHEATITDLPAQRDVEWYLLWWDERGATGGDLSGLRTDGWFETR